MAIPSQLVVEFTDYHYLTFIPIGRKNKTIRSLANKHTRGLLTRINHAVSQTLSTYSDADQLQLSTFLFKNQHSGFPLAINREEEIFPHLWKPDTFLWKEQSAQTGVPIHLEQCYKQDITTLSKEQLQEHIDNVIRDYMFCAQISQNNRENWLHSMNEAFHNHPFIKLYHQYEQRIEAIERVAVSPLLFLMKQPEKVAYWRERVEIIMRPFRMWSKEEFHEGLDAYSEVMLSFEAKEKQIVVRDATGGTILVYHVPSQTVTLKEEVDVELASKRLYTTSEQLKELMLLNPELIQSLHSIQHWKDRIEHDSSVINEINNLQKELETWSMSSIEIPHLLSWIHALMDLKAPRTTDEETIEWLSFFQLEDVSILSHLSSYKPIAKQTEWLHALTSLKNQLQKEINGRQEKFLHHSLDVGKITLTPHQLYDTLSLIHDLRDSVSGQLYTQLLTGHSTNNIRQRKLDEHRGYGALDNQKEKYLYSMFETLQKWEVISKLRQGYTLTPKGHVIHSHMSHHM